MSEMRCPRCLSNRSRVPADGSPCDVCTLEDLLIPRQPSAEDESFGHYEILYQVGEGGLGTVYLAEQRHPVQREVALKVIKPGLANREVLARLETERQVLAMLEHPHIARMIDAGTSSLGRQFLVMEYVDGVPVNEYCDRAKLDIPQRLNLFLEICQAVDYAHRKGIIHRDLKPSNILVYEDAGRPIPKIIDYGIAKALDNRLAASAGVTEAGQLLGTPEYMSPEQADLSNHSLDAASDVYSLGVLLYELLCGALPFDSERFRQVGLAEILRIVREEEPPTPRGRLHQLGQAAAATALDRRTPVAALERQLSGDLALIVQTALAKDRGQRYLSAAALAADVQHFLRHEPVKAHAPGVFYRAGKLAHRRRGTVIALASAFSVLACCIAFFLLSRGPVRHVWPEPRVTPVTSYNGYEFDAELSPDGKNLAFVWDGDSHNYDIYVRPVEGGDPVRLTTNAAHDLHPSWSPDGLSLAFVRTSPSGKELFIIPSAGGPERKLLQVFPTQGAWEQDASIMGQSIGPDWSPSGDSLAVSDREGNQGPDCLYLISPQSGAKRQITWPEPGSVGDSLPAFSPNGEKIAFVRMASERGNMDIYLAAASGAGVRRLTFDSRGISGLTWASERRLLFTSNRTGPQMLWSLSLDGGPPESIAIAGTGVSRVSALPRLGKALLDQSFRNTNIWRVDLRRPGSPAERLISTTLRNDSPKYSPSGNEIVFGSNRSGNYELWITGADGLHARQLTSFGRQPVGTPRWSPDGKQIVFDGRIDGHSVIYTVDAAGGAPRVLVKDRFDNLMPSWSSDGRFVYFASRQESNVLRLWKKPLDGGPPVQLTQRAGGEGIEKADGSLVYFSDGHNGIWQVDPDGRNEQPAPGIESVHHSRYFAVTARGLYFLRSDVPPWLIQFYNFNSHKISSVTKIEKRILYGTPNLTVSPDGHWLLYTQLDDSGSDVMLLDGLK